MVTKCAAHLDGSLSKVCNDQFYWKDVEWLLKEERQFDHLPPKVFKRCNIILLSPHEFDGFQCTLTEVHEGVKKAHHPPTKTAGEKRKAFDDDFSWHTKTNYHEAYLVSKQFSVITSSTLVAIDDGSQRFEIVFLYWRKASINSKPMHDLCDYLYVKGKRPFKNAAGESVVQERSDKTMAGQMSAFGSWDARGNAKAGLGEGVKEVRVYNPNGKVDPTLNRLVVEHVEQLTAAEMELTPSCAQARSVVAESVDPHGNHRMSDKSFALAMTASLSFVTDPHNDSGSRGISEFIEFVNATGPLPPGHKWLFCIAGFLCELPTAVGEAAIIALPACGVYHGTLPTSSTTDTYPHGNYGSALITKKSTVDGLIRQDEAGNATDCRYWSSKLYFGGKARNCFCEYCGLEGTYAEVLAHERTCAHA